MSDTGSSTRHLDSLKSSSRLEIKDLRVYFDTPAGSLRAVDGVSLDVFPGEIVTVVGESGSGKSVTALSILRLIETPPGRFVSGSIRLVGKNVLELTEPQLRRLRGAAAAMLFQNPRGSLDPSFTITSALQETLRRHQPQLSARERLQQIEHSLHRVGFHDWQRIAASYPHQLSGGMCQRVALAIALACKPAMLVADEPTTALDVSVQAKVLRLLRQLNQDDELPILLITHDFGVVSAIGHRVVVMYAGQIVEQGPVEQVLRDPLHPYSKALINSVPDKVGRHERLYQIPGTPPGLINPPTGCRFADRCEAVMARCRSEQPLLQQLSPSRIVRCHLYSAPLARHDNHNEVG